MATVFTGKLDLIVSVALADELGSPVPVLVRVEHLVG